MDVEVDYRKDVQENAAAYYEKSKKLKAKAKGAADAAEETKKKLAELEKLERAEEVKHLEQKAAEKARVRVKRDKEWFERFRWFRTSNGFLVVAGRDSRQNDILFSKHFADGDLFFHAEIHGAPVTIMKEGETAQAQDRKEAAQFAGSYSSAWKIGSTEVDVYAMKRSQVSKHGKAGEYAGKGGFMLFGEREWYRSTPLGLLVGVSNGIVVSAPASRGKGGLDSAVVLLPGGMEKGAAAKQAAKELGQTALLDDILQTLPAGESHLEKH